MGPGFEVRVRVLGRLADYLPGGTRAGAVSLQVRPGESVGGLRSRLGFPPGLALVVLIDGKKADEDRTLAPGDSLTILAPTSGG